MNIYNSPKNSIDDVEEEKESVVTARSDESRKSANNINFEQSASDELKIEEIEEETRDDEKSTWFTQSDTNVDKPELSLNEDFNALTRPMTSDKMSQNADMSLDDHSVKSLNEEENDLPDSARSESQTVEIQNEPIHNTFPLEAPNLQNTDSDRSYEEQERLEIHSVQTSPKDSPSNEEAFLFDRKTSKLSVSFDNEVREKENSFSEEASSLSDRSDNIDQNPAPPKEDIQQNSFKQYLQVPHDEFGTTLNAKYEYIITNTMQDENINNQQIPPVDVHFERKEETTLDQHISDDIETIRSPQSESESNHSYKTSSSEQSERATPLHSQSSLEKEETQPKPDKPTAEVKPQFNNPFDSIESINGEIEINPVSTNKKLSIDGSTLQSLKKIHHDIDSDYASASTLKTAKEISCGQSLQKSERPEEVPRLKIPEIEAESITDQPILPLDDFSLHVPKMQVQERINEKSDIADEPIVGLAKWKSWLCCHNKKAIHPTK